MKPTPDDAWSRPIRTTVLTADNVQRLDVHKKNCSTMRMQDILACGMPSSATALGHCERRTLVIQRQWACMGRKMIRGTHFERNAGRRRDCGRLSESQKCVKDSTSASYRCGSSCVHKRHNEQANRKQSQRVKMLKKKFTTATLTPDHVR